MTTDNSFGALKDVQVGAQMDPEQEKKELAKLNLQYEIYKEQFEDILSVFVDVRDAGDEIADKDVKKAFDKSVDAARAAMDRFMNLEFVDEITTSMKVVTIQNDLIWKIKELVKEMAELADVDIVQEKISNREGDKKSQVEQDSELFAFFEDLKTVGNEDESVSATVDEKLTTMEAQKIDNVEEKISWHDAKAEAQDHGEDSLMIREELNDIQTEMSKMDKAINKLKKGTERDNAIKKLKEFKMQAAQKLHKIVQEKIAIEQQREKDKQTLSVTAESNKQAIEASLKKYDDLVARAKKDYSKNKRIQTIIRQADQLIKKEKGVVNIKNPKTQSEAVEKLQKNITAFTNQISQEMQNVDDFEQDKNSYDEFIAQVKKKYAKNKKVMDYVKNADKFIKEQENKLKKVTNGQQREKMIKSLLTDRANVIDQTNSRINRVSQNKQDQTKDAVLAPDDNADVLSLDDDIKDTLQLSDDDLEGIDDNLFSADTGNESVTEESITKNVQAGDIEEFEENEQDQTKDAVVTPDDNADVLSLDEKDIEDTLQLDDDDLGDIDENLFGNDTSDESVTEDLGVTKVQIDGIESFDENEREIITSVFVFAQKTFEGVDQTDEEKMLEFVNDIKREFTEEYSIVGEKQLQEMTQIILDSLDVDSSILLQHSQEDDTTKQNDDEKADDKDVKSELENSIGAEVYQFALEEIQLFYNDVRDNADWDDMDDIEKEERLAEVVDEFIGNIVEMIDWKSAQNDLTKQEKMELFKKSFFVE